MKGNFNSFLNIQPWDESHYTCQIVTEVSLLKRHYHKKTAGRGRRREKEVRKLMVWLSGIHDTCCCHWVQQDLHTLYTSKKTGHSAIKSQKTLKIHLHSNFAYTNQNDLSKQSWRVRLITFAGLSKCFLFNRTTCWKMLF